MERNISEAKYHKLATEYAKVRAQAGVLKKAVLEEQAKGTGLRDQLRQRETALRRAEQEVDSLGFRNKQLEHRVAVLQEEIAHSEKRTSRTDKSAFSEKSLSSKFAALTSSKNAITKPAESVGAGGDEAIQNALMFEELQKKIMENAQLTSLIDDKQRDLNLHSDRISNLEQTLEQRANEHAELEKRLRRDIDALQSRNAILETKFECAASMLGSEDALSVAGSEHANYTTQTEAISKITPQCTQEERIASLERDAAHWRAQYEIAQLTANTNNNHNRTITSDCSCSSSAAGIKINAHNNCENKRNSEPLPAPSTDQIMHNRFSEKYEQLLQAKCFAESHLASYVHETENLQNCLENATHELKAKEQQIQSINEALRMLEDDLTTTRINYEEQISVLTEQVVSLSEQLAACK